MSTRAEINLFDPVLRRPRNVFPARLVLAGWVGTGAVLLAALAWQNVQARASALRLESVRARQTQLEREVKEAAATLSGRSPSAEITAERAERERVLRDKTLALEQLRNGEFGSTSGHSALLTAFARNVLPGLWLTGVTVTGSGGDLVLEGRTLDPERVSDYLRRLGQDGTLRGQAFNRMEFRTPHDDPSSDKDGGADAHARRPPYVEFVVASRPVDAKGGSR